MKESHQSEEAERYAYVVWAVPVYLLAHMALRLCNTLVFTDIMQLNGIDISALTACMLCPLVLCWYYKKVGIIKGKEKGRYTLLQVAGISVCLAVFTAYFTVTFSLYEQSVVSVISFLGIVIAGPINEEILYRGILFDGVKKLWGGIPAMLISAVLFGVAHNGVLQVAVSTLAGFVFCLVFFKSNSIVWAVAAHIGVNLLLCWKKLYNLPAILYFISFVGLMLFTKTLVKEFWIKIKGE